MNKIKKKLKKQGKKGLTGKELFLSGENFVDDDNATNKYVFQKDTNNNNNNNNNNENKDNNENNNNNDSNNNNGNNNNELHINDESLFLDMMDDI